MSMWVAFTHTCNVFQNEKKNEIWETFCDHTHICNWISSLFILSIARARVLCVYLVEEFSKPYCYYLVCSMNEVNEICTVTCNICVCIWILWQKRVDSIDIHFWQFFQSKDWSHSMFVVIYSIDILAFKCKFLKLVSPSTRSIVIDMRLTVSFKMNMQIPLNPERCN